MSSCSMTSTTSFKLSMKPLTATRSIRLVVALYRTSRSRASSPDAVADAVAAEEPCVDVDVGAGTTVSCRLTSGESSGST